MVLTEATGDAELVVWDGREFGHIELLFTVNHLVLLVPTLAVLHPN